MMQSAEEFQNDINTTLTIDCQKISVHSLETQSQISLSDASAVESRKTLASENEWEDETQDEDEEKEHVETDEDPLTDLSDAESEGLLLEESDSVLNIAFSEDTLSSCNLANITECTEHDNLEDEDENKSKSEIAKCLETPLIDTVSLVHNIFNNIHTQEPWPQDVKMYQPYEMEQILLPDNANCLAVQAFLKMCNLDFKVEHRSNAEAMSPSGKVPFIKAGAFVVAELQDIVQFANRKGHTLTANLEEDMKADLRAYMTLVYNVIEIAELYVCWCDKETYNEVTSVRNGSIYPWPLNHFQNISKKFSVAKKLKILGWYQKSLEDILLDFNNSCQALSDRLENNDYFFKNGPTELDALVFGHLFTILTTPLPNNELAKIVRNYPTLVDLVKRIEEEFFKKELKV